jgi:hypothetical protein
MCIPYRQRDPRTRARMVIANFSLSFGLALWLLVHPASAFGRDAIHFVVGLLFGLAITINLMTARRNCRSAETNLQH